ncbi:hypothetical protein AK812_SmicGene42805 [Symbiodinium microadriaticum]|uniref:Uncharacterized protein n=1 Tax=Symbiodinium microadriaticum TaxID=2951 RepID=A0A1Q9C2P5_SYMMI|nr:hypothetical protein AK812_SmicGene42805 [Symbiodinium microadriaticum]
MTTRWRTTAAASPSRPWSLGLGAWEVLWLFFYPAVPFAMYPQLLAANPPHRSSAFLVKFVLPVCIEQYAELANVNTSNNEQFNNWLSNFQHTLRHMRFETMEIYLLLIGCLWNAEVVLRRAPTAFASSARSRAPTAPASSARSSTSSQPSSLLKRRRAGTVLV